MALMVQPYVGLNPGFAYFTSFIVGAMILLLGVLNLGENNNRICEDYKQINRVMFFA